MINWKYKQKKRDVYLNYYDQFREMLTQLNKYRTQEELGS